MRKRIMAMLLALVMVVGVLPVAALAEEPVSTTEPTTVPTETTAPTEAVRAPVANSTGDKGIALQSQQNGNGISPRASSYVTLYLRFFSPDAPFYATGTGDHTEESVTVSQEIRRSTIGKDEASGTVTAYFKPYKTNGWMLYYKVTIGNHEYSEMSNYACCIFNKDMSKATGSATFNISFNSAEDPQTTVHISGAQDLPSTTYTVTYTDGVNGAAFPDQSYSGLASGATTPEFNGTPTREGFVWVGWNPAVTSTVTKNATYTAVWEEAVPSKPEWSDIRGEMQKVSVHVTCINPDVNHTDKTYPYQESTDDVIGYVQDSAGSYTCTVTVHLGRYRTNYNSDFNREHQFASSLTADVVLQYNGTGWVIASALPLELKLTCGSAPTPDPPGQDVLGRLLVQVECDAITYHFTKTYQLDDGDYRLEKVDDNTYTVTVTADKYVEKYNIDYGVHTLFDNNTKTIKLVYRYGAWTVVGSNGVTFNVSCEQKYTVTYTDGVDGEVIFNDQVYYKKPGEKTPAFRGTPTRTGYKFIGWEPAVAATVTGNATYTAVWEEEKYTVTYTDGVENEEIFADQVYGNLLSGTATPAFNGTPTRPGYVFTGWNPTVAAKVTESKIYSATWKPDANGNGIADDLEDKFTVTYTDGMDGKIFVNQVYENLLPGTATPAFNGTPTRTGYVFGGWNPAVAAKVTESKTYTATWKPDVNGNGIADDLEDKFTVTYTDGVENEEIFADQVYGNLLSGTATPAFNGTPTRTGYVFGGWNPAVAAKVTGSQTYTATWKLDANGNGIADDEEDKFTVTYTDGADGKAFADQVYDNLLSGTDTPAFSGKPTRKGYTFVSWTPKVTDTVTKTVTYTATWKANSGKDNVPKTGDSGIVPVLGSVLLFSFCGAAACVFDRKRKHI